LYNNCIKENKYKGFSCKKFHATERVRVVKIYAKERNKKNRFHSKVKRAVHSITNWALRCVSNKNHTHAQFPIILSHASAISI